MKPVRDRSADHVMRARILRVFLLPLVLAGCGPDEEIPPLPTGVKYFSQVSGTWDYTGSEVRLAGSAASGECAITGVVLDIEQIKHAGAFSGRSSGGVLTCQGELSALSGPLQEYPVGDGYTFNGFIGFDIGTPDWRHEGKVDGESMGGTFKLRSGSLQFEGKYTAVRRRR